MTKVLISNAMPRYARVQPKIDFGSKGATMSLHLKPKCRREKRMPVTMDAVIGEFVASLGVPSVERATP